MQRDRAHTLERRREDTGMIQTYKIITGVDNVKKDAWFKMAAENAERVTRATSDKTRLAVNRVQTDQRGHFFSQRVVEGWNKLSAVTRDAKSVKEFKRGLQNLREERLSEGYKRTSPKMTRNGDHRTSTWRSSPRA